MLRLIHELFLIIWLHIYTKLIPQIYLGNPGPENSSEFRLQQAINLTIEQPTLKNPYVRDPILKAYLQRVLPDDVSISVSQ